MSPIQGLCAALLVGALAPAISLVASGRTLVRLVGVELTAASTVVVLLLLSDTTASYDLLLPLVLVPLAFAGTLVFTRLLRP